LAPSTPNADIAGFDKEITRFEQSLDSAKNTLVTNQAPRDTTKHFNQAYLSKRKAFCRVELNKADSASLESLPGIGPVFSKRIVKYRNLLGGYYSIMQLNEVFGMKPEILTKIQALLSVDTLQIQKLDINKAGFKEINAHPYISYEQTKMICKARLRGNFVSIRQIEDMKIFTPEELVKIRPYLAFNN
jgi:competence protein ComEA